MRKCPACGFNNGEGRERCLKCSSLLEHRAPPDISAAAASGREDTTAVWYGELRRRVARALDWVGDSEIPERGWYRYPAGAALMCPIPGAPQFYTSQVKKGLLYGAVVLALEVWVVLTFFEPHSNRVILAAMLAMLFSAADGYQASLRINGRPTVGRYLFGYWFGFIFIVGMVMALTQWWAYVLGLQLVAVTSDDLRPAFRKGDRVLVTRWPVLFGSSPERGDVVYYTAPSWSFEMPSGDGNSSVRLTAFRSFGVVSGLEGDRVHWQPVRGERWEPGDPVALMLNGEPATDALLPLLPAGMAPAFDATVPAGAVAVPLSTPLSEFSLGPSWGGEAPTPAMVFHRRYLVKDFQQANLPPLDNLQGVVLLRYNPPERRAWFGRGRGVPR
ncbi:MAG: S26 family signal peptidase [Candidatus Sumerlaeia bacterium]|nr:S26 family signal peptidase [Candidatus Sumerlaeia bacterium]